MQANGYKGESTMPCNPIAVTTAIAVISTVTETHYLNSQHRYQEDN